MDRERKRLIAIAVFFGIVLLVLAIFFFFGDKINRGTLVVEGEAPFTVEVFRGDTYDCLISPCDLEMRAGRRDLILRKQDHKNILSEAKIKRWKKTPLKVNFEINPQIVRAESLPQPPKNPDYKLVIDENNGMQKLVEGDDSYARAIIYFQDPIISPRIIPGKKSSLIIGKNSIYRVDLDQNSRIRILNERLADIDRGSWSLNGKYLIFTRPDSKNLWLLNEKNEVIETDLAIGLAQTAWAYDNSLVFVTGQGANPAVRVGKYGENYIELLDVKSSAGFTFGFYHPDENSYTKIDTFGQIPALPEQLIPSANSHIVYFRAGSEDFKIILRKF